MTICPVPSRALAWAGPVALLCGALAAGPLGAQPVQALSLRGVPPDLIPTDAPPGAALRGTAASAAHASAAPSGSGVSELAVDLGEPLADAPAPGPATGTGPAQRAAQAAAKGRADGAPGDGSAASARGALRTVPRAKGLGVERAVYAREPVRVQLVVGQERLISLPAPAALHVPADLEQVARVEVIERTIYLTPLVAFAPLRIRAELIDSGQHIPLDLVASEASGGVSLPELEVAVVPPPVADAAAPSEETAREAPVPAVDMVQLTRHAARQVYAPRRLAWATPGVQQLEVNPAPVAGLIRGADVVTQPLGQWRAGALYVTAVRVQNRSRYAQELALEQLRGRWIAATAQHGRIGPAGSETGSTALYLVCDRRFEACL
jgi:integrating conjugative element protein (TIGR03749 family)